LSIKHPVYYTSTTESPAAMPAKSWFMSSKNWGIDWDGYGEACT